MMKEILFRIKTSKCCKNERCFNYYKTLTGLILIIALCFVGFSQSSGNAQNLPDGSEDTLFTLLQPSETGIHFTNNIYEDGYNNITVYDYMYNGSGVGIGDFNNDGLQDIYFAGNMVECRLYLNKGNMQFEDITQNAGVNGQGGGVMALPLQTLIPTDFWIYMSRDPIIIQNPTSDQIYCISTTAT